MNKSEINKQKAIASNKKQRLLPKIRQAPLSQTTLAASTPAATNSNSQLLIDKIDGKGNAEQAIVVTTNGFGSVSCYHYNI